MNDDELTLKIWRDIECDFEGRIYNDEAAIEFARRLLSAHTARAEPQEGMVMVPRAELEWMVEQWDDSLPSHELTHRLYDVVSTAKKLLHGD